MINPSNALWRSQNILGPIRLKNILRKKFISSRHAVDEIHDHFNDTGCSVFYLPSRVILSTFVCKLVSIGLFQAICHYLIS